MENKKGSLASTKHSYANTFSDEDNQNFNINSTPELHTHEDIIKSRLDDEYGYSEPYSIVWTTLPLISWILPFIGHTGITE